MPDRKRKITTPAKAAAIRLLVAEDHSVVRDGLAAIINQEADMTVVAQARNGIEAVELWKEHRPDITLMDLQMPQRNGVDAIYQIRAVNPDARIIVLTTFDGDEDIYRGMKAGAKSYLLKDAQREELFQCIREVNAGRTWMPQFVAAKLAERISGEVLTTREIEVLTLLAKGKSNKEIGTALFIGEGTVKAHIKGVFGKLNVISRTEAIAVAAKRGIIKM